MELLEDECRGILTVVGGAFERQTEIRSTSDLRDAEVLEAEHEVADTRIVLHVIHCAAFYDSIVVRARDTDILLLLVHHYPRFNNKCV